MSYKVITKGRMDFGTLKTFDLLTEMYNSRVESYYKNMVLFRVEEVFKADELGIHIQKHIAQSTNRKSIKNTIGLLKLLCGYGISGKISMWVMREGKLIEHHEFEPNSDRGSILSYQDGCEKLKSNETEEAIKVFTRAIGKNENYADAYAKRGEAYLSSKEDDKAMEDFQKAVSVHPENINAQLNAARLFMKSKDYKKATTHLDAVLQYGIPHEYQYWMARYLKGEALLAIEDKAKAEIEFKFFTRKEFEEDNPNFKYKKSAHFTYGKLLINQKKSKLAAEQFKLAKKMVDSDSGDEMLTLKIAAYEGYAKFLNGQKSGYQAAWRKAAKAGMPEAKEWLAGVNIAIGA